MFNTCETLPWLLLPWPSHWVITVWEYSVFQYSHKSRETTQPSISQALPLACGTDWCFAWSKIHPKFETLQHEDHLILHAKVMLRGIGLHQSVNITVPVDDVLQALRTPMTLMTWWLGARRTESIQQDNCRSLKVWLASFQPVVTRHEVGFDPRMARALESCSSLRRFTRTDCKGLWPNA